MTDRYAFDPDAWTPAIAGLVAGAIGAIVAAIVGWTLTEFVFDQPHTYTNTLTVTIVAVVLGLVSGGLWGSLRASENGHRAFVWSMVGGFVVTIIAVLVADQSILNDLAPYAVSLTAIIFITLAFLTPLLSQVRTSPWVAAIPVLLAVGLGVGLFV